MKSYSPEQNYSCRLSMALFLGLAFTLIIAVPFSVVRADPPPSGGPSIGDEGDTLTPPPTNPSLGDEGDSVLPPPPTSPSLGDEGDSTLPPPPTSPSIGDESDTQTTNPPSGGSRSSAGGVGGGGWFYYPPLPELAFVVGQGGSISPFNIDTELKAGTLMVSWSTGDLSLGRLLYGTT